MADVASAAGATKLPGRRRAGNRSAWRLAVRARATRRSLIAALLLAVVTSCSGAPPAAQAPALSPVTSALPPGPCGDNQPGRYSAELFQPAQVNTVAFSGELQADIYTPAADPATCRVGIVWVHGGGFTMGTRNGDAEHAWGTALAARGYLLASIDYRLGRMDPFGLDQISAPQRATVVANAIADAQTAIRWLRDTGPTLGVDPARLAIGGTSAGAMTAMGAELTATDQGRGCTAVSVSGDIDDSWVGADPPPALFIHGNADDVVPYDASVDAVRRLTAAGGEAALLTIDGAGHELTGVPRPEMVQSAAEWFREHTAAQCG